MMDRWSNYLCYKVFCDEDGSFMQCPKYVSFKNRILCGFYDSETEAGLGFLRGEVNQGIPFRLDDFVGIDGRVK